MASTPSPAEPADIPSRREIRGWLTALSTRSTGRALALIALDLALFAAGLAATVLASNPWLQGLAGVATGLASQAALVLTYPLGRLGCRPGRTRRSAGPGTPTVVCLHGLYHNAAAFLALGPALGRAGLPQVLCLAYSSFGGDFETVAQGLLARLRRSLPPQAPLLFLDHSLGGLLARRLAAEPDIGKRTLALVTLGAPHRGSELAALAVGRLGRGLVPGSPLFGMLDGLPDPPGAALLSLASPVDNMVIPLEGLVVGRPGWREEATPPVSHVAMLYHPAVTGRAAAFLRDAARRAAGPEGV